MTEYKRYLRIELPKKQSAFLWGARKTGKSTYLKQHFPDSVFYDLLKGDVYVALMKEPYKLREEILALPKEKLRHPVIIDEVQKVPELLSEIHWMIENTEVSFILCGSSARELTKARTHLLGGRAWRYNFYPLVYPEIEDFNLLRVLNYGTIPSHYNSSHPKKSLKAYVEDYLTEEVKQEGLVHSLPAFSKFLDSIGYSNGQMINYANIASACAVNAKTVREYYQILADTLLGYFLPPYHKKMRRALITATPKFYLFDVGVANVLSKSHIAEIKGSMAGQMLEQYIFTEIMAFKGLNDLDYDTFYWRTTSGLEVDFILVSGGTTVAIEVKVASDVNSADLKGLLGFAEEHPESKNVVVCMAPRARKTTIRGREVLILPVEDFLKRLWNREIV